MAEKEDAKLQIDLESPDTKVSYANHTHIIVNATDVDIYFGISSDFLSDKPLVFDNKIIINHASFMKMMAYWASRYALLHQIYGGDLKSINDFDNDIVSKAFAEMYNGQGNTDTGDESEANSEED